MDSASTHKSSTHLEITVAIDISKLSSSGQMVHLEFSLSLEQVDKTQSYYLEIKAPQNSDNTITWYGSKNVDNLATLYNGTAVAGEAGYVAYKSNLHTLDRKSVV